MPVHHTLTTAALTIAGSDSGAGAGVQADLKTFAAHGVYGTCAITAVTAQNTRGVTAAETLSGAIVRAQIDAVMLDFPVRAAKTGMLATAAIVSTVAEAVRAHGLENLVVDPVMLAKSGDSLLDAAAVDALRSLLLPRAAVVTPNIPEAEVLAGMRILTDADRDVAAERILALGPRLVIIKGGHAPTDDIVDSLYDGERVQRFSHARVPGTSTHGTGCTFAAALAAHLALGRAVAQAIPLVQAYIAGAIRHAPRMGDGHGPMHHFWNGPAHE
jgi:hydroxymethylpyrimidine/phosphomethylpyrimidine kinase